jgi:hypothetical protein
MMLVASSPGCTRCVQTYGSIANSTVTQGFTPMRTETPAESVELRFDSKSKNFTCKWGDLLNTEGDPLRACGIQHLILSTPEFYQELLDSGPREHPRLYGATMSAFDQDGRGFIRLEYQGNSWTWEMHKAHWWDDGDPDMLIGRWAD